MTKNYKSLTTKEMAARLDGEIDCTDVAELDETFWANAEIKSPRIKP